MNRDLVIALKSKWDDSGFKDAEQSAKAFSRELARMERAARQQRAAMEEVGQGMATFGAATVAAVGLAVKAAVDWETAWTGVTKTVEGTPQQMAALEGALRGLARELPTTHKEIAAVAEAAGQLGVKREAIIGFTKTMVDLGNTTNLSAEEAATALARFSNIMGTSQQDVSKLGSALVALGNDGASTEKDIMEMALRIAGAGKTIGLTEAEVMGFASALSSVGIEAEMGGSAISRVMVSIAQAVDAGGERVQKFAAVAGMSAAEFSTAFREDAASAIAAFISGLGRVEESGGSVFATLQQLGFVDVEVRDALLRTANAGDLLAESLRTGEQAWEDNSALAEEAGKRYDTTASRMQVAQNQIVDFGITVGQTFLPVVGEAADKLSSWIDVLGGLPEPVKQAGTVLGTIAGVATLVAGAFFMGAPKVAAFKESLDDLGPRAQRFGNALSTVGSVLAGPWGLALGVGVTALGLFIDSKAEAAQKVAEFTRTIESDTGAIGENTRALVVQRMEEEGLLAAAKKLGLDVKLVTDAMLGKTDAVAKVNGQLQALSQNVVVYGGRAGQGTIATKQLTGDADKLSNAINGTNAQLKEAVEAHKRKQEALGADASATEKTKSATDDLRDAMKGVTGAADSQTGTLGSLTGFVNELADAYGLAGEDAAAAAQQMLNGWSSAFSSFGNVSSALQAVEQAASQSSSSSVSSADRQAQAAERLAEAERQGAEKIKRAKREVADAKERAAEVAAENAERIRSAEEALAGAEEDAARRVADAQEKVADARRRVSDAADDGARKVEAAAQKVADAERDAAERVADAERRLQDSHRRTAEAVDDLSEARERAAERIADLERATVGAALDEEGAEIAIERARERLAEINADPDASDLDRREADLAYRRAIERLNEIRQRNAEMRQELDEAHRAGVEGSAEVIQAREKIAAAQEAEREAELNLARTREDNARSVAAAEQSLADARSDAARQQEEAERALAKAEADLDQVRKDGARDVLQAKRDVAEAEKEAAKASKDASRDIKDAAEALREAQRDAAADAVRAHDDVKQSWSSLGSTAAVTTGQLIAEMEKQVREQEKWADNLISLAGRVPDEMLKELAEMGPGGARVVALMTEMTDQELQHFIDLHKRSGKEAGDTFARNLAEAGPELRRIAKEHGEEVADRVREGMDGGRHSVLEAARRIGLDIDAGLGTNRTIHVSIFTDEYRTIKIEQTKNAADGGIFEFFAGGGESHVAQIASANTIRVWAEPETGGEAYIPLAASKRARSEEILSQVAERFGGRFYRTMPVSRTPASAGGSSGVWRPAPVYNISVTGGLDSGPEIGRRVVAAIQDFERRSGDGWRR
ncbi:phage tail tape measure protein [[Actinomadura] parvosata]|uniref:phage tail tape measure protein n=1 Tax=[Actinomadura] parvosata TaxID=1955412 RepID=UPI00406D1A7E